MLIIWLMSIYIPYLGDCSELNNTHKIAGPDPWNLRTLPYLEKKVSADMIKYLDMGSLA